MKNKKAAGLLTLIALSGATMFFAFKNSSKNVHGYKVNFVLAKTSNELRAIQNDPKANIIRTKSDFDAVVQSNSTPLSKLSDDQIKDFRDHLVERDGLGIISMKFGVIQAALSADDFAEVMGMFGVDTKEGFWGFSQDPKIIEQLNDGVITTKDGKVRGAKTFTDYDGYYCSGPSSCSKDEDSICLTGC